MHTMSANAESEVQGGR